MARKQPNPPPAGKRPALRVTAALVNQLREEEKAPMMEVRAALVEAGGNLEKARALLRQQGRLLRKQNIAATTGHVDAVQGKPGQRFWAVGQPVQHVRYGTRGVLMSAGTDASVVRVLWENKTHGTEYASNLRALDHSAGFREKFGDDSSVVLSAIRAETERRVADHAAAATALPLHAYDACESIDASIFSSDLLEDVERRKALRAYVLRWLRALNEHI